MKFLKGAGAAAVAIVIWALLVAVTLLFRPAPTVATRPGEIPSTNSVSEPKLERGVSEPYTGDLAIFEDPKRAENLQIERVMDILGIKAGTSVADIGAGSGWFAVRAARRTGPSGKVYAVEINQEYLEHIRKRATTENLENVTTVAGRPDDPMLPGSSVDAVLILKTYHEIAEPIVLIRHLKAALRPGGFVGIIDRNGKGDDHGVAEGSVIAEMRAAGFEKIDEFDFVKPDGMDYFLVFKLFSD